MTNLGETLAKINLGGVVLTDAPLANYTTFATGGPAEALVFPKDFEDVKRVRNLCQTEKIPLFVMGRGANILVSDLGVRGVTLNLTSLAEWRFDGNLFIGQAGLEINRAIEIGRNNDLSCLEFLYGMPSSLGGAVWMNARCYGHEVAEVFSSALVLDEDNRLLSVSMTPGDWDYKKSPFQRPDWIILEVSFQTKPQDRFQVTRVMEANLSDRTNKGHFRLPCAGSVFKNDRRFGEPSGVLIDRCGLKGLRQGNAAVSDWHGNIIVNEGRALASDIKKLILKIQQTVLEKTGFPLEEEIIYVGDWNSNF